MALDLSVDMSTPSGRLVANVFASVAEWERELIGQRTREGLAATRAKGQPISRPAAADNPRLRRRIAHMRERGMTLAAIADKLNRDGVPTVRGGAKWRHSTVQTASGYRRPRPARKAPELPAPDRRRRSAAQ